MRRLGCFFNGTQASAMTCHLCKITFISAVNVLLPRNHEGYGLVYICSTCLGKRAKAA